MDAVDGFDAIYQTADRSGPHDSTVQSVPDLGWGSLLATTLMVAALIPKMPPGSGE